MSMKTKWKSAQNIFHSFDEYEKVTKETWGHLTSSLMNATKDLNNTWNLFHGLTSTEKQSSMLNLVFFKYNEYKNEMKKRS